MSTATFTGWKIFACMWVGVESAFLSSIWLDNTEFLLVGSSATCVLIALMPYPPKETPDA